MSTLLDKIAVCAAKMRLFARRVLLRKNRFVRAAAFIGAAVLVLYCALRFIPEPALNRFVERQYSARFYDRNGIEELYEIDDAEY